MAGSIISVALAVGPISPSYKPDVGSYGVLIGLGSPFSVHYPSAGGIEVFVFMTLTLKTVTPFLPPPHLLPPILLQLYFPTQATLHFVVFPPCG